MFISLLASGDINVAEEVHKRYHPSPSALKARKARIESAIGYSFARTHAELTEAATMAEREKMEVERKDNKQHSKWSSKQPEYIPLDSAWNPKQVRHKNYMFSPVQFHVYYLRICLTSNITMVLTFSWE